MLNMGLLLFVYYTFPSKCSLCENSQHISVIINIKDICNSFCMCALVCGCFVEVGVYWLNVIVVSPEPQTVPRRDTKN